MMSENIARNMYSSQGIINYPAQLHLVGHFRILDCDRVSCVKHLGFGLQVTKKWYGPICV